MHIDIIPFPTKSEVVSLKKKYDFIINAYEERYLNNIESEYHYAHRDSSEKLLHFPMYHKLHPLNWTTIEIFKKAIGFVYSNLDKKIIIHCRSGLHRSKMIKEAVYFMVKGVHKSDDGVNILIENCIERHAMFPVTLSELEEIILNVKKEIDGKKQKEIHDSN